VAGVELALAAGLLLSLGLCAALWRRVAGLERQLRRRSNVPAAAPSDRSLNQVGLVRYQAYHDVGGDHSFALALLDSGGEGVVVNSLYHRDRCRVYAKPVSGWRSPITLTDEEVAAIELARGGEEGLDSGRPGR
jgi:Protein of unknown function (DUF4446)